MKIKKKILILGSTGSIGKSTLNVIKRHQNKFKILCLSSNKNYKKLYKQSQLFSVKNLIINDYVSFLKAKKFFKNKKIKIFKNLSDYLKINKNKNKYRFFPKSFKFHSFKIIRFTFHLRKRVFCVFRGMWGLASIPCIKSLFLPNWSICWGSLKTCQ